MAFYVTSFSLSVTCFDADTISQLMHSNTSLRQTRMLVTKIIRLTIETGSVTGMYSAPSIVARITPTSSCCRSAQLYPLLCVSSSELLRDTSPHRPQAVCKFYSRGPEFANPNSGWTEYLYVVYGYKHHNHDDKGYDLPVNRRHTAYGRDARTGVSGRDDSRSLQR